jgi:hypothetical protein
MDNVYVVVKVDPVDGVRLSNAFRQLDNAQLFAQCYGGSVRAIQVNEDDDKLSALQIGHLC